MLGEPISLPAELNEQRIFVKGYVHPGVSETAELRKFILVPDMGTCCFGGQPALSDMIEVSILGDQGIRYTRRKRKEQGPFTSPTECGKWLADWTAATMNWKRTT